MLTGSNHCFPAIGGVQPERAVRDNQELVEHLTGRPHDRSCFVVTGLAAVQDSGDQPVAGKNVERQDVDLDEGLGPQCSGQHV